MTQARHRPDGRPRSGHPYKQRPHGAHPPIHRRAQRARSYTETAHRTGFCCSADTPPASSSAESENRLTTKRPQWFVISCFFAPGRQWRSDLWARRCAIPVPRLRGQRLLGWSDLGRFAILDARGRSPHVRSGRPPIVRPMDRGGSFSANSYLGRKEAMPSRMRHQMAHLRIIHQGKWFRHEGNSNHCTCSIIRWMSNGIGRSRPPDCIRRSRPPDRITTSRRPSRKV